MGDWKTTQHRFEVKGSKHSPSLNMLLTSSWVQYWFVSIVPRCLNFSTISSCFLPVLLLSLFASESVIRRSHEGHTSCGATQQVGVTVVLYNLFLEVTGSNFDLDIPQLLQTNAGIVPRLGHDGFLSDPFQFISAGHPAIRVCMRYWQCWK
jgi:Na+(H+)/acetate symporter ActP